VLIAGLVLVLGVHMVTTARGTRAALVARLGEGAYKGLYSIVSAVGLVLIVWGFGRYRSSGYIPVWDPPSGLLPITLILMWFSFVALVAAYAPAGKIKGLLRHPMLVGVKAWALAHLLANGDLGSIILFGALLAWALGLVQSIPPLGVSSLLVVTPAWDLATLIGLGVPLYLVTMASQNLPGFAVLRAFGYKPPSQPVLAVTGIASLATAFVGAHTSNLAAISAALCTGPEAHPDPAKRWIAGVFYALWWGLIALFGASLVGLFGALPPALLMTVAGLALLGSMASALGAALGPEKDRFAAAGTLAVTASGITLMGVGSAFWGLVFGLLVLGLESVRSRLRAGG